MYHTGKRTLIVRGGSEGNSCSLEIWMGNRVTKELVVPKKQHGGVYNDGWFGSGAAWSPDESRLAYVAEVSLPVPTTVPHQDFPVCCKHSCCFITSLPRHSFMLAYELCTNVQSSQPRSGVLLHFVCA